MASPIVHFNLAARDLAAARHFYAEVMGWEFGEGAPGAAGTIDTGWADDIRVSGTLLQAQGSLEPGLVAAIRLDDLDAAVERCEQLGGTVVVAPRLLPTGVTIAVIRSPEGVAHTLVQQ